MQNNACKGKYDFLIRCFSFFFNQKESFLKCLTTSTGAG